ncbi:MAG: glycosyltransferase family 2 protein [Patescibacteria group bacterium]|nr:glycosyltransferase family 2 protein [Patescibacteria group bacterium]
MNKNITILTVNQPNISDYSKVRNLMLQKTVTDWSFFLDSDETLTTALKKEINKAIQNKKYNYQLKRQDYFLGRKLRFGETSKFKSTRLIQKNQGQWRGRVHEIFISSLPTKLLKNPIIHQRNITVSDFINKINHYSELRSKEINNKSLLKLLFYPPLKFIQNYIFRLGFLDGIPGFIMAFLMSFHSLMVRIKVYENKND